MTERALWETAEVLQAAGGKLSGEITGPLTGVAIDSRTIEPGDIFVAIKGERLDGHDYAASALKAGAGLAIVSRVDDEMRASGALLHVDDPLAAMNGLAVAARARCEGKIIAVTGSVGKTTTKEALRLALQPSGRTHAAVASFNNHWGVPLTLARMPRDTQFGVFEIGMNHPGEITPLVAMVRPEVAIITTIAECHIGHFNSLDEIADAKAEIFSGLLPEGVAVINRDTEYFERLSAAARQSGAGRVVSFGLDKSSDVFAERVVLHATCSCVTASVFGEQVTFKLGAPGEHVVANVLGVLAAVKLAGGDLARAALALAQLVPAKGRGVRHKLRAADGRIVLIDESYNANPASMRAAFALLKQAEPGKRGRRIAVLGDMLELGERTPDLHAGLARPLENAHADTVYACGSAMAHLWEALPRERRGGYAASSQELKELLLPNIRGGDVIMVKGSLGSRMAPVVEAIRERYAPDVSRD